MNSSSKYITSGDFIAKTLKKCKKCFQITDQARMIVPYDKLLNLSLIRVKSYSRYVIIMNSEKDNSSLGHWFNLAVFDHKFLVLCDGLGKIFSKHHDIMQNIYSFCKKHHYRFINLGLRYQLYDSLCCGYLALFIIAKTTKLSFKGFLAMKKTLMQQSISSNEKYMLKCVKLHFKL